MDDDEDELRIGNNNKRLKNNRTIDENDDTDDLRIELDDDNDDKGNEQEKKFVRNSSKNNKGSSSTSTSLDNNNNDLSISDKIKNKKDKKRLRKEKKNKKNGNDDDDVFGDGGDDDDDDISAGDEGLQDDDIDVIRGEPNSKSNEERLDDDAFIDKDDDNPDLVEEYGQETQNFPSDDEEDDDEEDDRRKKKKQKRQSSHEKKKEGEKSIRIAPRKGKEIPPEEKKKEIDELIKTMKDASEADRANIKNKKPAIEKLGKLEKIMQTLNKRALWQDIFESGAIEQIIGWLTPVKGIMTNLGVRKILIELLSRMPINLENLKQDNFKGLSNLIAYLSESSDETQENKKILDQMLVKWKMEFLNPTGERGFDERFSSNDFGDEETRQTPAPRQRAHRNITHKNSRNPQENRNKSKEPVSGYKETRASVPAPITLGYARSVEKSKTLDEANTEQKDQFKIDFEKRLENVSRKPKKSARGANLSIEGRGI